MSGSEDQRGSSRLACPSPVTPLHATVHWQRWSRRNLYNTTHMHARTHEFSLHSRACPAHPHATEEHGDTCPCPHFCPVHLPLHSNLDKHTHTCSSTTSHSPTHSPGHISQSWCCQEQSYSEPRFIHHLPLNKSPYHKPNHVYPSSLTHPADHSHLISHPCYPCSITYSSAQCHTQSHHHTHSTTPPQSHSPLCFPFPTGTKHHPRGYPIREVLTSLHLQLYGSVDPLLPVVVPDLHHEAAVEAAVQRGQVEHDDGEVAMVVRD